MSIEDTHKRRVTLQKFATLIVNSNPNKCEALVDIVKYSGLLVTKEENPADKMMEDLKFVMIGERLNSRGTGNYFFMKKPQGVTFFDARGSCGFKPSMADRSVQISHAVAGIYIGYHYSAPVEWVIKWLENEQNDDNLYDATFPIGDKLTDENYNELWKSMHDAICLSNAGNCLLSDKIR